MLCPRNSAQVPAEFHFPFLLFRAGFSKDRKQCPGREECGSDEERVESVCSMRLADHMFLRVCSMHL